LKITIDTSTILAVVLNEPEKHQLIEITKDAHLIAPMSLHWEIGNAFSLMFKKKRIIYREAIEAYRLYQEIPLEIMNIDMENALEISHDFGIYAYDAYMLSCAVENKAALLTLDYHLSEIAIKLKIKNLRGAL
jgi:predicted nucleic acid-binding protein